ncbi:hypothetical protein COT75_02225 [Candidatus Beckwithbacteria bacterium CG10_big_fil_rev_8_21_14_0_10_34_10]|uniref:Glycosyltransferase RgtA/B/C/D-like domain-containing protein n=1 Tax=Candidatus Beckwithbacteria bacterium CG10_big_fil_rev_8_21_14_0_10_34_10 TaxID=1974495 RepID=A0A2H0W9F3_9BACT|nr:MAG: hypothetical protein COT75_02225 [Candidatus Beckwithbacteria bacterium CG10_big_fil_rev_8_21_14_0_10_34_10]
MKKEIKTVIILLLGFLIRLILSSLPGFKADTNAWYAWADRLVNLPLKKFYSSNIWTHYTPGYLYILWILGIIKKIFNISDPIILRQLFRLPSNVSDFLTSILIFKIFKKKSFPWKYLGILYFFNPVIIFNSSVWGQVDSVLTLLLLVSIYFLLNKKIEFSGLFYALAFLVKPQAVFLAPVYFLFFLKKKIFSSNKMLIKTVNFLLVFLIVGILISWPFFPKSNVFGLFKLINQMGKDYPYSGLGAFNLWQLFEPFKKDNLLVYGVSRFNWGLLLYSFFTIIISFILWFRRKTKNKDYYLAATIFLFIFFLFPTRIHERYLFSIFPFLLISAGLLKSRFLIFNYLILSLFHFLNMVYIYCYYYPKNIENLTLSMSSVSPKFISLLTIFSFFGLLLYFYNPFLFKRTKIKKEIKFLKTKP